MVTRKTAKHCRQEKPDVRFLDEARDALLRLLVSVNKLRHEAERNAETPLDEIHTRHRSIFAEKELTLLQRVVEDVRRYRKSEVDKIKGSVGASLIHYVAEELKSSNRRAGNSDAAWKIQREWLAWQIWFACAEFGLLIDDDALEAELEYVNDVSLGGGHYDEFARKLLVCALGTSYDNIRKRGRTMVPRPPNKKGPTPESEIIDRAIDVMLGDEKTSRAGRSEAAAVSAMLLNRRGIQSLELVLEEVLAAAELDPGTRGAPVIASLKRAWRKRVAELTASVTPKKSAGPKHRAKSSTRKTGTKSRTDKTKRKKANSK